MPVSLLKAHEAEMWEVHFHPSNPDHLFTCSEDGSLWHWDASTDVPEKSSLFHQGGRSSTFCLIALVTKLTFTSLSLAPGSALILQKTELKSQACFPVGLCL